MLRSSILKIATAVLLIFGVAACKPMIDEPVDETSPEKIDGWVPVYDSTNSSKIIKSAAARPIVSGGRIYVKGAILYQVEAGKGIHVIDITDRKNPVKKGFIEVSGCQEMSIKGDMLYTNNLNDLVVIDISNQSTVVLADRVSNAFNIFDATRPPSSGWYECIDTRKGKVVGWEMKSLNYPQCR